MEAKTKPTIYDIARETGLSTATISRALHHSTSPNVSQKTRQRVQEVAESLGYQTNLLGRSLSTGRSHTVAYWTVNAFSPYYGLLAEQVCRQGGQSGYSVVVNNTFDPVQTLKPETMAQTGTPFAANYDGIIACDVSFIANNFAAALRADNKPWVGINNSYAVNFDHVGINLRDGGEQVTRHLLEGGCRRIAMMIQGGVTPSADPRSQAYTALLEAAGLEPHWIIIERHRRNYARERIVEYVAEHRALGRLLPDAIFCVSDEVALGCSRGLHESGVRVPDEVRLVGCDGIEDTEYQTCPISTLVIPTQEMCTLAWQFLENRIEQRDLQPQQVVLKPQLVVRESSRFDP